MLACVGQGFHVLAHVSQARVRMPVCICEQMYVHACVPPKCTHVPVKSILGISAHTNAHTRLIAQKSNFLK